MYPKTTMPKPKHIRDLSNDKLIGCVFTETRLRQVGMLQDDLAPLLGPVTLLRFQRGSPVGSESTSSSFWLSRERFDSTRVRFIGK